MNDDNSANAVANNISAAALLLDEWKWRHPGAVATGSRIQLSVL
ncbi:MAG: hypothetical protein QOH70_2395 [Blastocatellia bacterium]|jgi:hypothetical protein|nr:hypothetical protein [Blastocatellia bacterium]